MPLVFRPKLHKIVALIMRLAETRPGTSKYRAVKYIWLADLEHLNTRGRPISFDAFYALPSGPVAINALNLIEGKESVLQAAGLLKLPFETYPGIEEGKQTIFVGCPKPQKDGERDPWHEQLSRSDIAVFDRIADEYKDWTAAQLKALTHEHVAYTRAWNRRAPRTQKSLIDYADMISDGEYKNDLLEDLVPIAMKI